MYMDSLALACVEALAPRAREPAVHSLLAAVAENFTVASLEEYQAFGWFDDVKELKAGGAAAALL